MGRRRLATRHARSRRGAPWFVRAVVVADRRAAATLDDRAPVARDPLARPKRARDRRLARFAALEQRKGGALTRARLENDVLNPRHAAERRRRGATEE